MAKKQESSVLQEHDVQRLNDYQHARLRSEMYLGSRSIHESQVLIFGENSYQVTNMEWVPALLTACRELWDNSLDEFKKAGTKEPVLKIEFDENELTFSCIDNGRGIPIDYVPDFNTNLCTMVMTETKTGRNFDDSKRDETIGQNGLGGSVAMLVSSKAEMEIHRKGRPYKTSASNDSYDGFYKFSQNFKEGTEFIPEIQISEPVIRKISSDKTGTSIRLTFSPSVFPNRKLPIELLYSILKEMASANPTYKIFLNNKRINVKPTPEKTLFNASKLMQLNVNDESFNFNSTFYIIPNAVNNMNTNFHMHGLVNNAPAFDGGTHLDTFKKHFSLGIANALEKEAKKRKMKPNRSDIEEGLLIYNVTTMKAPSFNSQIKSKLTNENVVKPIQQAMSTEWFDELVKKNKDWVDEIFERCAARTNKKDAEEDRRLAKKLLKGKVAKLLDSVGTDRSKCILMLAEGDSAISNMASARDPNIHGILPLRGKIMNVSGEEKTKELMDSDALHDIMASINLVPGVKANRDELSFGKLYIATDEDTDGLNIAALICNFLYKFWPELFQDADNPFVYVFKTPFIILEKGKESKYFYGYNVSEYNPEDWKGWKATRAKGLGTLEKSNFRDAFTNSVAVAITDDGNLGETLDLIFNKKRADDRKAWMA
ncbi:topoisomerase II large subunit [Klebsiella phage vB_KleM_RaK2]|uniref:DNA topoisomerase 2 n=1 Tax=Klebsiella phage vB_KleM_RaK2 TaxID=1147094 RepID=H6X3W4_9CAUD|nr:DNA topoisomerase II [Klebsiella phage vB_KleM_RaK2]AFA44430.1 topoisomerase II large subunit [Klebsiella phage vB_KleM_RaK2]